MSKRDCCAGADSGWLLCSSYVVVIFLINDVSLSSGSFLWFAGIPVVQLVAGSRVSTSTDEGFALALSDSGDVYSWGKGYKGRLGHSSTENVRSPKMVDALGGKDIKMVRLGHYHYVYPPFPCGVLIHIALCC